MKWNPIELSSWGRKPYFEHYLDHVRCTYSITAELDITRLLAEVKGRGLKLYPALIYAIATAVNRHREFRTCLDTEGNPGYWDEMAPGYTVFHEADRTFSSLWTPYGDDFRVFHERYLEDTATYGSANALFAKPGEPPNVFPISSIPWVSFTGFNLNIHNDGTYLLPIFTMGKYVKRDGGVLLPVSAQLHHAVCDGYHAGVLFEELRRLTDGCESWLDGR